jgi:hypothetical protein
MRTVLFTILLAAAPSLLAVLWLVWQAGIFDRNRTERAPHRRRQKKHAAAVSELDPGPATEFPIAPEVTGTAIPARRPRRRAAARA